MCTLISVVKCMVYGTVMGFILLVIMHSLTLLSVKFH